ncbi:MAG: betaine-aldehyde dehydrogenase [Rhizobiales bacterium]|nr:betaine-aldehyde dehydrogenase [Hyphomicrobiales bacterium]MBA70682.1 betaine-aldehyde dehydrogenase [Hyphomicrobiales bacterium]|tara:strand:- start:47 stop:1528 length:1482 start_codon:yes stop_codon:yes gene_type:complete
MAASFETLTLVSDENRLLLIDGKFVPAQSGETFPTFNPSTGEVLAQIAKGEKIDIDNAVAAARRAFTGPWAKMKPFERQEVILRFAELVDAHIEDFSRLDAMDMGAPITATRARRQRAVGMLRYYAAQCTHIAGSTLPNSLPGDVFAYTLKEPVGVVGAILPWNAPLTSAIWKIGPVLATGCTMVLKPSEIAPLSPLLLGKLALEAGVPPGVLNIVPGMGDAGAALAAHPDVDKIAFTGSGATGAEVLEASKGNFKRVTLELGGKSPDVVFADADLDKAVPGAAMGIFANTGQVCCAGSRLLVERSIYEEFTSRVADYARQLRVGDSLDEQTQLGPISSAGQLERVSGYLDISRQEGLEILTGGDRISAGANASGYFFEPTVIKASDNRSRIAREEIFGPVVAAIPFDDMSDAMRIANDTEYGLGAGIWTRDVAKAHAMAKAIRSGSVWVNCYGYLDPVVPFGGYGASGYGRESGVEQLQDYLETKSVMIQNG